jgi:hypothetical protein
MDDTYGVQVIERKRICKQLEKLLDLEHGEV